MAKDGAHHSAVAEHMRPRPAADYLGVSVGFLNKSRVSGTGPRYVKISPTLVIYRRADLDAWLADRLVGSTSEAERLGSPA